MPGIALDWNKFNKDELQQIADGKITADDIYMQKYLGQDQIKSIAEGTSFIFDSDQGVPESEIVEEMHKDLSWKDRAIVKNFGTDINSSVNFLKKKYKDFDVTTNVPGDRIIMKKKGEDKYHALDPEGFDLQDITDIAYDIPAAAAETAATVGAGLLGGAATGGVGALGAAGLAGGLAATGTETLRQAIGSKLGLEDNIDPTQIALSGAFGAASPLLLGTGAGVKEAAKFAAKRGLAAESAEALAKTQKSIPGKIAGSLREKLAPTVGEMFSGVPRETIDVAKQQLDKIDALTEKDLPSYVDEITTEAISKARDTKKNIGQALDKVATNAEAVDVKDAARPLQDYLVDLESREYKSADTLDKITQAREALEQYFAADMPGTLVGKDARALQKDLDDAAEVFRYDAFGRKDPNSRKYSDKQLLNALGASANIVKGKIDQATGGVYKDLSDKYRKVKLAEKTAKKYFGEGVPTLQRLRGLGSPSKEDARLAAQAMDETLGTNLIDTGKFMDARSIFHKPQWFARSAGGTTSTSRTIPTSVAGAIVGTYLGGQAGGLGGGAAGGAAGAGLGALLGGPRALRGAMKAGRAAENFTRALQEQSMVPQIIKPLTRPQTLYRSGWYGMTRGGEEQ